MFTRLSRFNRFLLILMFVLYLITLGAFIYLNWQAEKVHVVGFLILNAIILSLPLILLYGSIYVLVSAWREHRLTGQIGPRSAKVIHWAPRIAGIVIIFFVSLFSLDVFEMEGTPLQLLAAFLIHSVPALIMIVLLVFAWRWPVVGFVAFLAAGLFFLRFVIPNFNPGTLMLFTIPLLLISGLFFADWRWHKPQATAV